MKWKLGSFFALALCLCGTISWALTLSDLLTQARVYLRDTQTSRPRFTDAQLTSFLNNGQKEINSRAWCVVGSTAISLQSGTTEYSLPQDCIAVLRVTINQSPIVERTFTFLDEANRSWLADAAGAPKEFYVRVDSSIVAGVQREAIGVHPVSTFSATMIVQYVQQPVDMSVLSEVPFSGNYRLYPYHQALAYYAAFMGYMAMGMKDDAVLFFQQYQNVVDLLEANDSSRVAFNPNFRGNRAAPQKTQ